MPLYGLTPFLRSIMKEIMDTLYVSMPFIGLIPFLQKFPIYLFGSKKSVNALTRAYTISTTEKELLKK